MKETRDRQTFRNVIKSYIVCASAGTSKGAHGCRAYLAKDVVYSGKHRTISLDHVAILIAEPDLLIVLVHAPGLRCGVVSAHAPYVDHPQ